MDSRSTRRNTCLFIALLLLNGVIHALGKKKLINYLPMTICFCVEYLTYIGLILFWIQSVNERLLPTRAKRYALAAGRLMLLFIAAQLIKYRIALTPDLSRYCWYAYYPPMLFLPTFFLMTCYRLGVGAARSRPYERLLLIPAGLLSLGVLTNDWHGWAFVPKGNMTSLEGKPNTYTYGFLYHAVYVWIALAMVGGVILLVIASRRSGSWRKAVLPLCTLAVTPFLMMLPSLTPKGLLLLSYEVPEFFIFSTLGVFESCIRSHLIPSNENYPGFFSQLDLPALVTDGNLRAAYRTHAPVPATEEQLRASLRAPVFPSADMRLYGMKLQAGYAFWTEDESALNRLNEELQDANDVLLQENEILKRERELAKERAMIEQRSRLYQQAAREVYPTQRQVSQILDNACPATASFRPHIAKALALMAYVKRKANFVLVEAERETISARELASALEESAHFLRYCGLNTEVNMQAERSFPCREAMVVYDCFESVCEALIGQTEELFVRLRNDELLMMADLGEASSDAIVALRDLLLSSNQTYEDGQWTLRLTVGGEAA